MKITGFFLLILLLMAKVVFSGEADVMDVEIQENGDGSYTISVTVQHDDEGWEHYADRWEILAMDGSLLDTRVLAHPHSPMPFTRSLVSSKIPLEIEKVQVQAHDNVHGYGGRRVIKVVPRQ